MLNVPGPSFEVVKEGRILHKSSLQHPKAFLIRVAIQPAACAPRLPRNKKVNANPARKPPMCAM